MTDKPLDCIEILTAEPVQYSVIWLHGLGASGHDFEPIVPELKLPATAGIRFVFPHAPVRPITVNAGMEMRGWYDIRSLDFGSREQDAAGIEASAALVEGLIDAEVAKGVTASKIILAGFSQGGAIALFAGLTGRHTLAGIIALSCYLPIQETVLTRRQSQHLSVPIFMAHGQYDDVIQIQHAEQSRNLLLSEGFKLDWHSYPIAHSVSVDEIDAIAHWLKNQLGL